MKILLLLVLINVSAASASGAKDSSVITIILKTKVGTEELKLGKPYHNILNEAFSVTRFKYYISNVAFLHADGTSEDIENSYFLVNEEDSASKVLTVKTKNGSYNGVSFLIGVDSIKNVSGTQADALDPMNGMFWTWNSGYIMAKLEGTSPLSKSPNHLLEYHIGGFRINQNTVRRVTLSFPANRLIEPDPSLQQVLVLNADINKWFEGAHELKISEHTACTTPGDDAVRYADNYAKMFTVVSINYACKER